MQISSRALESKTHKIDINPNNSTVLITRIKPPHLVLAYNLESKEHVILESDKIAQEKINAAVTKAIAFANHNLIR